MEKTMNELKSENEKLRTAINLILDNVDYSKGYCRINEMVGAVLPNEILRKAHEALKTDD